jgi:hypothetical protein
VVIPVFFMGGVAVAVMQVVGVVLVRHGDMPAALAVLVVVAVVGGVADRGALVDMVAVNPVDVAVVGVVGVVAVREGDVAAVLAMGVRVAVVYAVFGGGRHGVLLLLLLGCLRLVPRRPCVPTLTYGNSRMYLAGPWTPPRESVRTLDGENSPVAAPAWAGRALLITGHRDGRVRAYGLPSRAAL